MEEIYDCELSDEEKEFWRLKKKLETQQRIFLEMLAPLGGYEVCPDHPDVLVEIPGRSKGLFIRRIAPHITAGLEDVLGSLFWDKQAIEAEIALDAIRAHKPKLMTLVLCIFYMQESGDFPLFKSPQSNSPTMKSHIRKILAKFPHFKSAKNFENLYNSISRWNKDRLSRITVKRLEEAITILHSEKFFAAKERAESDFKKIGW